MIYCDDKVLKSENEMLKDAYHNDFTAKESILYAYDYGFIWDYERDFLLEYFNV